MSPFRKALPFLLVVLASWTGSYLNTKEVNDAAEERAVQACERGNALREVVFKNTRNAVDENAGRPEVAAIFQENLSILVEPPEISDTTGLVECEAIR